MSKTFISTTDHYAQMGAMEDKISKLEGLVWTLYKELSHKIDSNSESTQLQFEEITGKIYSPSLVQQSDDGYEGSEEKD